MPSYSPGTDIAAGGWTAVPGGALYSAIAEEPFNDQNWVQSSNNPSSDTYEVKYSGVINPGSLTGNFVNYRLRGDSGLKATVNLVCGTTIIASWTHDPAPTGSSYTAFSQLLTQGQSASIADWTDLRLRIVADQVTVAPPAEGLFPSTYTIPSYQDYAWGDVDDSSFAAAYGLPSIKMQATPSHHITKQIPADHYVAFYGISPPSPGNYLGIGPNGSIPWRHVGGDWADLNNVAQGATAFASTAITTSPPAPKDVTWNVTNLVQAWGNGTYRNAGLWLRASNSNTVWFATRFATDSATWPYLIIDSNSAGNGIKIACGRSAWINNSSESAQIAPVSFSTSGTSNAGMLWFDLSAYPAGDITAATLHCWCLVAQTQTVNIFRVVNPADQAGDCGGNVIDTQHAGIAANYPNDVGIGADASVYLVQTFASGTVGADGVREFDRYWGAKTNSWATGAYLITAPDGNGFTPVAGIYNALHVVTSNTDFWNCHFSPWRGWPTPASGYRLKPYTEIEEGYVRFYLMWGNDWDPQPNAGKMPGFDGRYADLTGNVPALGPACLQQNGMGRGNSGSGTDGLTGWSARMNYDRTPTPGNPLASTRAIGNNDIYHADMSGTFGDSMAWDRNYLDHMVKGQWNCIESRVKLNTVTLPNEKPRRIVSWSQSAGVATAVLQSADTSGYLVPGAIWAFGGSGNDSGTTYNSRYNGEHTILSVIDQYTFTHDIDVNAPATPTPGSGPDGTRPCWFCCTPSRGNFDGIVQGWVNGRLAFQHDRFRFRHSRWRIDGAGIFGIDAWWFTTFNGGADPPKGTFSFYVSNIVCGTSYIGPMYIPPSGPTMPSWYPITTLTWTPVGSDGNSNMDNIANSPDYSVLTTAGLAPVGAHVDNAGYTLGQPTTGIFGSSGGTVDGTGTNLLIWGGGGAGAWAGNEVRTLDLMLDNPVWRIPTVPSVYNQIVPRNDTTWLPLERNYDGKPVSRHSYWRPQFIKSGPYANSFFVFGHTMDWARDAEYMGTAAANGRVSSMDWTTKTWRPDTEHPYCPGQLLEYFPMARDPATDNFFVWGNGVWVWSATANTWTWIQTVPYGAEHGMAAVDTDRHIMARIGASDGGNATWNMVTRDFSTSASTFSTGNLIGPASPTGTDPIKITTLGSTINPYVGFVYDSGLKAFLLCQVTGVIFKITPSGSDWYCETLCATPSFMNVWPGANSILGRMQYIPSMKGIVVVWEHQRAYFLRTT